MTDEQIKALKEVTDDLLTLPKDEFDALLAEHQDGDVANALLYSEAFRLPGETEIESLKKERDLYKEALQRIAKGAPNDLKFLGRQEAYDWVCRQAVDVLFKVGKNK